MESLGAGTEEEHRPPIVAAAVGCCRARFRRERRQCDRIASRSGVAHGGACALGGTGERGRLRGAFGGRGAAGDGRDTAADGGADRAVDRGRGADRGECDAAGRDPPMQVEVAAALTDGS